MSRSRGTLLLLPWIVLVGSVVSPGPAAAQPPACDNEYAELLDQVMAHLGFNPSQKADMVERDHILHTAMPELEQTPEDLVVTGAMLVVHRPMAEVVEAILDENALHHGQGVLRYQAVPEDPSGSELADAFSSVRFDQSEASEVKKLIRVAPGGDFNLAAQEIGRFGALSWPAPTAAEQASAQYQSVLMKRFKAYRRAGLAGIAPYARKGGKMTSAAEELTAAIEAATFLKEHFPAFVTALLEYPQPQEAVTGYRYFWLEKTQNDRPVYVLSHHTLAIREDFSLVADLQFYVGHSYNAMLTLIGVLPCDDDTLVVAFNHTFTEQVSGFGSTVKKKLGRKVVAEEMALEFADLRADLESGD